MTRFDKLLRNTAGAGDVRPTERTRTLKRQLLAEIRLSRSQGTFRKKNNESDTIFANAAVAADVPPGETDSSTYTISNEPSKEKRDEHSTRVIKIGVLSKTTISHKEGSKRGQTRHRHFRLTEEALEYLHQFSQVNHTP